MPKSPINQQGNLLYGRQTLAGEVIYLQRDLLTMAEKLLTGQATG